MPKFLQGLDEVLKDFSGTPVQTPIGIDRCGTCGQHIEQTVVTAKKLLTDIVGRGVSQDPIHAMEVGRRIFRAGSELELDDSEMTLLTNLVTGDQAASNIVKGFLLPLLSAAIGPPPPDSEEKKD